MSIVQRAKEFAINAHGNQKYGKMPYEYHLQQVVGRLRTWQDFNAFPITDNYLVVGWLHDIIEDTSVTYDEIYYHFGYLVAQNVYALTKNKDLNYEEYIHCIKSSPVARLVKIADTMANLEASLMSGESKRVNKYAKQLALLTEV